MGRFGVRRFNIWSVGEGWKLMVLSVSDLFFRSVFGEELDVGGFRRGR